MSVNSVSVTEEANLYTIEMATVELYTLTMFQAASPQQQWGPISEMWDCNICATDGGDLWYTQ